MPKQATVIVLSNIDYYNRTMAKPIKWTYTGLASDRGAISASVY